MILAVITLMLLQADSTPAVNRSLQLASSKMKSGDYQGAKDAYEQLLSKDPDQQAAREGEIEVSEKLALAARAKGDNNAALGILLSARAYVAESPRLLYDLGVLEDELGLFQEAESVVLELQKLTPDEPKVLYLSARVKLDRGELPQAEDAMRAYLRRKPDDATAYFGLGRILQLRLQNDAAREAFNNSLELRPVQTESLYQLADMALKENQYQGAIELAKRVLARDPRHGGAMTVYGIALYRQKDYAESAQMLRQATLVAPDYQPAHYYLGLAFARLGRDQESNSEFEIATQLASAESVESAQRLHLNP